MSKVTIVDIDGELIDICRRHLPALSAGAFDDPRVEVIAADGSEHVSEADQLFDTIIIRFPWFLLGRPPPYSRRRS